jgi:hypothetical protein
VLFEAKQITQHCSINLNKYPIKVSEWNVETALSLYFENNGAPLGPPEPIPESENPYSPLHESAEDSDEAFARQLQEEQYSRQSDVRAPIAPKTDVLVGDDGFDHTFDRRGRMYLLCDNSSIPYPSVLITLDFLSITLKTPSIQPRRLVKRSSCP